MVPRAARLPLLALLLAGNGAFGSAAAQSGTGFTTILTVLPLPSPFIADWERNPQMAQLTIIYTGSSPQDVNIVGYVRSADRGELARVASPVVSFGFGPVTQLFNSADILEWRTVSRNQQYTDMVMRAGVLPEGRLEMCAEVRSSADALLAQTCTPFTISLPDPPQLIFPMNRGIVAGLQPVFQWTPVRAPAEIGVTYRIRAFEIFEGQLPAQAVASNPPRLDAEVQGAPMLVYPIDALPLEDKKEYAWQVEALDAQGNRLARGGRSSEIWTFRPGGPGRDPAQIAGVLPDVIDLIPGVARLKGLRAASVDEGIGTYVLNGRVRMELLAPFAVELDVDADELAIDRVSLATQPRILTGALGGALGSVKIPEDISGRFVRLVDVRFTPDSGLTMGGQLALPGATALAMVVGCR